jgi:hypothetical protein
MRNSTLVFVLVSIATTITFSITQAQSSNLNERTGLSPALRNKITSARVRSSRVPSEELIVEYNKGIPSVFSRCGGVSVGNIEGRSVRGVKNTVIVDTIISLSQSRCRTSLHNQLKIRRSESEDRRRSMGKSLGERLKMR